MPDTVAQAVAKLRFVADETGVSQTTTKLKALAGAQGAVAGETTKAGAAMTATEKRLDALQRRYDREFREQKRIEAAVRDLNRARAEGLIGLDRYDNLMKRVTVTTDAAAVSTGRLGGMARGLAIGFGFFAGSAALRGFQDLLDAGTRVTNSLRVAGLEGEELTEVYNALLASAQRNAAPLEALVGLYGRAAMVQRELGASTEEMIGFTDKVAVSLRVSGRSASESSGALLQLSQALGSGVVRAEEFNSILEGALPIAQAAAAGLEEAGGSVARLRQLVVDGEVSSEAFFRAFLAGSIILDEKVAGSTLTIDQGFQRLNTTLVNAAGTFDRVTGASEGAGKALGAVADGIDLIVSNEERLANVLSILHAIATIGAGASNAVNIGASIGESLRTPPAVRYDPLSSAGTGRDHVALAKNVDVVTVSLGDYAVAADKATKATDAYVNGVKVPLPNLRPEFDNIDKALERATDSARGFAETLVGGLLEGRGVADSLGDAVSDLASTLGTTIGDKVGGLVGGGIAGTAGSMLGSIFGPIGSALGSVAGDALGGIIDGVFGDEEERPIPKPRQTDQEEEADDGDQYRRAA